MMASVQVPPSQSDVLASVSRDLARLSRVVGNLGLEHPQGSDMNDSEAAMWDTSKETHPSPRMFLVAACTGVQELCAAPATDPMPATATPDQEPFNDIENHGTWEDNTKPVDDADATSVYSGNSDQRLDSPRSVVHEMWRQKSERASVSRRTSIKINEVAVSMKCFSSTTEFKVAEDEKYCSVQPHTKRVFFWDTIGFLCIMNDVILIPIQWLFDDSFGMFSIFDAIMSVYWTVDILLRFFVGYESSGGIEMRLPKIARHYCRGWFVPDVCACMLDWSFILQGQGGFFSRSWHIFRVSRTLRAVPRSIKFVNYAQTQMDRRQSETLLVLTKACLALFVLCLFSHYSACAWYALGRFSMESGYDSWLVENHIENEGLSHRYLASLTWSFSQSGLLCVDIFPTNSLEHLYCVCSTLVWIVIILTLIGCFNLLMKDIRKIDVAHSSELMRTRMYLKQRGMPSKLTASIIRSLRRIQASQTTYVQDSEVQILAKLPMTLQFDLRKQIYLPILKMHPLFQKYAQICKRAVGFFCYLAMDWRHYEAGHEVFVEDEESDDMLFVVAGVFKYFPRGQLIAVLLGHGTWVGEASLWMSSWRHRGQLIADTAAEVVVLNATKMREIVAHGETLRWNVEPLRSYAKKVVTFLNTFGNDDAPDQTVGVESRPDSSAEDYAARLSWSSKQSGFSKSSNIRNSGNNASNRLAGVDSLPLEYVADVVEEVFEEWGNGQVARHMYLSSRSRTNPKAVLTFLSNMSLASIKS